CADDLEVAGHVVGRELERRQEVLAREPALGAIEGPLAGDAEGAAEELHERVTEAEAGPAEAAPVAGALPGRPGLVANDPNGLPGGAPGCPDLDGPHVVATAKLVGVLAQRVLRENGKLVQVGEPADVGWAHAALIHHLLVVRALRIGVLDDFDELLVTKCVDARARPALAFLDEAQGLREPLAVDARARLPVQAIEVCAEGIDHLGVGGDVTSPAAPQ